MCHHEVVTCGVCPVVRDPLVCAAHAPVLRVAIWRGAGETDWDSTLQPGDCSMNPEITVEAHCRFAHPWIPDGADISTVPLVNGADAAPFVRSLLWKLAEVSAIAAMWCIPAIVIVRAAIRGQQATASRANKKRC